MTPLLLGLCWAAAPPPIASGEPTADYPAVAMLYTFSGSAGGAEVCTATLLSSTAFLTAAHCGDQVAEWQAGGFDVYLLTGADLEHFEYAERVDTVVGHPDWNERTLVGDIAVGTLERAIDEVEPATLGDPTLSESELGQTWTLVGWGGTAPDGSGADSKRKTTLTLQDLDALDWTAEETADGVSSCPGDSGAPLFRSRDDGGLDLVGVVSWGTYDATDCGPYTGGPRVDAYLDWVEAQLAGVVGEDTGDSGDSGGTDTADSGEADSAQAREEGRPGAKEPAGCGCASAGRDGRAAWGLGLVAMAACRRRRRTSA